MNAFFASRGLAVLTYDKRGCGGSGGDWKTVDLDVLAQDALAGVRWLKAQPGVDASRVGVWGISQGGWIGPLAASRRLVQVRQAPRRAGDPARLVADAGRAHSLLGWQPRHSELERIIADAWGWERRHPWR